MSGHEPTPDDPNAGSAQRVVLHAQVLAGLLIAGVCVFAGVAVFLTGARFRNLSLDELLFLCMTGGIALVMIIIVASGFVPKKHRGSVNAPLMQDWYLRLVYRLALCEGAAFVNVIFIFVTDNAVFLIPVAVVLFVMMLLFPTQSKYESFVEYWQEA